MNGQQLSAQLVDNFPDLLFAPTSACIRIRCPPCPAWRSAGRPGRRCWIPPCYGAGSRGCSSERGLRTPPTGSRLPCEMSWSSWQQQQRRLRSRWSFCVLDRRLFLISLDTWMAAFPPLLSSSPSNFSAGPKWCLLPRLFIYSWVEMQFVVSDLGLTVSLLTSANYRSSFSCGPNFLPPFFSHVLDRLSLFFATVTISFIGAAATRTRQNRRIASGENECTNIFLLVTP